jgi:uridine phosphorylase
MEERFTPEMFLSYYTAWHGIAREDLGVAPVCVLVWSRRLVESLSERLGARPSEHWMYRSNNALYRGSVEGHPVSLLDAPVGAPGTVMMMEEMVSCGARVFLGVGLAGSLQPRAPVGTILIPTTCIREEGTSGHYLDAKETVEASPRILEIAKQACKEEGVSPVVGPHWTTDAPYRELVSKIESYRRQGVIGVDMETSAMYALGKVRKVDVCNLLAVSDELWQEWKPEFESPELEGAYGLLERVLFRCLARGLA